MPGQMFGPTGVLPAAVTGTTTWDPAHQATTLILSNGNLTVTQNFAGSTASCVRAIASASSGLKYCELTITQNGGTESFGICNASFPLTDFLGDDVNSAGCYGNGNVVINNSTFTAVIGTFGNGDILGLAVDIPHAKLWLRVNANGWNNDILTNQNPATNTGGVSFSTATGGAPWFPAAMVYQPSDVVTANFGGSAYSQTAPSGFGNW